MLAKLCAHRRRSEMSCSHGAWLSNGTQACGVRISELIGSTAEKRRFREVTNGQLKPDDWNAVAAAFILAAQTSHLQERS